MPQPASLYLEGARRYVDAWAHFEHDDLSRIYHGTSEFYGTLGSLDFQYSGAEGALHAWTIVSPGAAPLLGERAQIKIMLDQISKEHPEETAGAVFDVTTLAWNMQATPKLEPCVYLRLDIVDASLGPDQVVAKLSALSRAGYIWRKQKYREVTGRYWDQQKKSGQSQAR